MSSESSTASNLPTTRYGLCARCLHAHKVVSAKESIFILCLHSKVDQAYQKYPPIPVLQCKAYKEKMQK